jgi:hypothetical protein
MKTGWFDQRSAAVALFAVAVGLAACGDDHGPSGPELGVEAVAGVYAPSTFTFDPQGSAPPANVLEALVSGGVRPDLNIALTGDFDIFFRDPSDGNLVFLEGRLEAIQGGVRLTFDDQADANRVVLPRVLSLTFDEDEGTLSFTGTAQVSRTRLLQLFPDLYQNEQFFDPTPGTLTLVYTRVTS